MEWEEICDYTVSSAYEFLNAEDIAFLLKGCKESPTPTGEFDMVDFLVESYGSDADVIQTIIEKKFPNGKYFWLCDFIDDEKRQEEYFHIRVWELNDSVKENESSELLKGEDVDRFYTVGNWNNNETIGVVANKKNYRLRVGELNKIKNLIRFKIDLASNSNDGRRTNNYLEIVKN